MSWSELTASLDAAAFDHLADDPAAVLSRAGADLAVVPVMLDQVERPAGRQGLALIERLDVVRVSAAGLAVVAPGVEPQAGDVWTVAGTAWAIRGTPYLDEEVGGRDWLCPVDRA